MLRNLLSGRHRHFAAVFAIAVVAAGICACSVVGISDYPEVAPTIVQVSAVYSGATPQVIADTVATPVEDQINSVEHVYFFDSRCSDSGSYDLYVTFLPGSNPDMNLVNVQNAVKRAEPKLPSEVLQTGLTVMKCNSDYAIQFVFETDGREMDLVSLGNFVTHQIKDALQRVNGVSSVSCSNNEYAMRIWLDSVKMDALGISVSDVRGAISGQNIQPAAGFVGNAMSSPYLSYKVSAPGRLVTPREFESIVVRTNPSTGARILLGDIARCELGSKSYTQEPRLNGRLCYLASAYADSGANTREVAMACRRAVDEWMARAPAGVSCTVLHDQTAFVREFLSNIVLAMALAVLLAIVLHGVFSVCSGGAKPAVSAAQIGIIGGADGPTAIWLTSRLSAQALFGAVVAVSLLAGALLLWAVGWTFDSVTAFAFLAGAAAALLVAAGGASASLVALLAAAFAPLALFGGATGMMFVRFSAVLVSITAMASVLAFLFGIGGGPARPQTRTWWGALLVAVVAAAVAVVAARRVPAGFVPVEDRGIVKIEVELSEGSSLARTRAVVERVYEALRDVPGVDLVYTAAGNSAASKVGENHAAVTVVLKPWKERGALSAGAVCTEIERRLEGITTEKFYVMLPTPMRGMGGTGGCAAFLCATGATDPSEQAAYAAEYAAKFRAMPDVGSVVTTFSADTPQLYFSVDRDKAQALGVSVPSVFSTLQSKLASFYVNDFNIESCSRQVIVQNAVNGRDAVEDALSLMFCGAGGAMVPLTAIGEFKYRLGPRVIPRIEKRVAAGVVMRPKEGTSTLELVRRIEADPPDPKKYLVTYSTMTREEVASRGKFGRMLAAGVFLMYLVLVVVRESWLEPLKLLAGALPPVAAGILGLLVCGQEFTILAQLSLVFLLVFGAALEVRPVRSAPAALFIAFLAAVVGAKFFVRVGYATFATFAVPLSSGFLAMVACHCGCMMKPPRKYGIICEK